MLGLTPGSESAGGIGIQLLDGAAKPVSFRTAAVVGPSKDGLYVVPYMARYYQTANVVKAGQAHATATFSIEYK